ncbi:quinone-dependent dihydroorotate dehydrogenase [Nigerium massiliense]|uniref:quinone-dependent dihydroorotate dehydrogenase n=1 Tax=Nigerium massiliense TaxID=1522317 RepID=UPI00058CA659|nr:quinone-dependent dihydroorotate dehydrogenase [Nigerium massiliense]
MTEHPNRRRLVEDGYARLLRPALFRARGGDPEKIHHAMIGALSALPALPGLRQGVAALTRAASDPVEVAGITFPGRVGLAAGMDKDGRAALAWRRLGFAFAELGTVTARPQPGNPAPRVFRLPDSGALINRMGFNNDGAFALANRLSVAGVFRGNGRAGLPLGISIGKSKVTPVADAVDDYLTSLRWVSPHADYVAINVSSPNTPGLRDLQQIEALDELVGALVEEARTLAVGGRPVPIFVKVSPDLSDDGLADVVDVAQRRGASGLIATNTTVRREGIAPADRHLADETGGLSGRPLTARALEVVTALRARTALPIIASGGIMTPDDARAMLEAGAQLVQLYTGFIYAGPALIGGIENLARTPERD